MPLLAMSPPIFLNSSFTSKLVIVLSFCFLVKVKLQISIEYRRRGYCSKAKKSHCWVGYSSTADYFSRSFSRHSPLQRLH